MGLFRFGLILAKSSAMRNQDHRFQASCGPVALKSLARFVEVGGRCAGIEAGSAPDLDHERCRFSVLDMFSGITLLRPIGNVPGCLCISWLS